MLQHPLQQLPGPTGVQATSWIGQASQIPTQGAGDTLETLRAAVLQMADFAASQRSGRLRDRDFVKIARNFNDVYPASLADAARQCVQHRKTLHAAFLLREVDTPVFSVFGGWRGYYREDLLATERVLASRSFPALRPPRPDQTGDGAFPMLPGRDSPEHLADDAMRQLYHVMRKAELNLCSFDRLGDMDRRGGSPVASTLINLYVQGSDAMMSVLGKGLKFTLKALSERYSPEAMAARKARHEETHADQQHRDDIFGQPSTALIDDGAGDGDVQGYGDRYRQSQRAGDPADARRQEAARVQEHKQLERLRQARLHAERDRPSGGGDSGAASAAEQHRQMLQRQEALQGERLAEWRQAEQLRLEEERKRENDQTTDRQKLK